jgi:hypothetical protein
VDFGITSEATSNDAVPTSYGRGTGGYRAPEILNESSAFTNKVDIWALGCIIYELFTGKRAFKDDFGVSDYYNSSSRPLQIPRLLDDGECQDLSQHETSLLSQLLARDPMDRPRITDLQFLFASYRIITCTSVWPLISTALPLPTYDDWTTFFKFPMQKNVFIERLSIWYDSDASLHTSIDLARRLVSDYPAQKGYRQRLENLYGRQRDLDSTINGWIKLVEEHPYDSNLRTALTKACMEKGGLDHALSVWKSIAMRFPSNPRFIFLCAELMAEICLRCDRVADCDRAVDLLKRLVERFPDVTRLQNQLKLAFEKKGDQDLEVDVWKGLVNAHPLENEFISQLKRACDERGDEMRAIRVWSELVDANPQIPSLQLHFRHALRRVGNSSLECSEWGLLLKKHSENTGVIVEHTEAFKSWSEEGNFVNALRGILSIPQLKRFKKYKRY